MSRRTTSVAGLVSAAVAVAVTSPAGATADEVAINGVYTATSDGVWAKTNESFHDEVTVVSTWTLRTTCENYQNCSGTVTSDQGWTADAVYVSGRWAVRRMVANWERCADGTGATGEQTFTFWPDPADRKQLTGWDKTTGPSGACGVNRWLVVKMPFRLTPRA